MTKSSLLLLSLGSLLTGVSAFLPALTPSHPTTTELYSDFYDSRTRKVAEAASAGKSRWGDAENQKALRQQEAAAVVTDSSAPATTTTTEPPPAPYDSRTRKVAEAATAGKSRWGAAENQKALRQQQPPPALVPMSANNAIAAPYEGRTRKVAEAATAGKSRWGAAENQRALRQQQPPPALVPMAANNAITTAPPPPSRRMTTLIPAGAPLATVAQAYPSIWEIKPLPLSEAHGKQSGAVALSIYRPAYFKNPSKKVTPLNPDAWGYEKQLSEVWNKGYVGGQ